jgi:hypothetical protein
MVKSGMKYRYNCSMTDSFNNRCISKIPEANHFIRDLRNKFEGKQDNCNNGAQDYAVEKIRGNGVVNTFQIVFATELRSGASASEIQDPFKVIIVEEGEMVIGG